MDCYPWQISSLWLLLIWYVIWSNMLICYFLDLVVHVCSSLEAEPCSSQVIHQCFNSSFENFKPFLDYLRTDTLYTFWVAVPYFNNWKPIYAIKVAFIFPITKTLDETTDQEWVTERCWCSTFNFRHSKYLFPWFCFN